jgi:hypothetical protein
MSFRHALRQGITTGKTPSFAVLGEWGIGKSSLLLKCSAVCEEPEFKMLPVALSVSKELGDYRQFAETLLDTFIESLARYPSLEARIRRELQNWKLKRINVGVSLSTAIHRNSFYPQERQSANMPFRTRGGASFSPDT